MTVYGNSRDERREQIMLAIKRKEEKLTYTVQQPDANTNPTRSYRVVLLADVEEALRKGSVVFEDYGRYASRKKAQADADKWNGEKTANNLKEA